MNYFVIEYSVFVIVFLLFFDKFHCVFYLYLKSIQYVCRMLILKFAGDKNDLHRAYVTKL